MTTTRLSRWAGLSAAVWAGVLICIGAVAAPSAFAVLPSADAGRVVARMLLQEAYISLGLSCVLFALARIISQKAAAAGTGSVFSTELVLVLGALFCTVAGHFGVQPMMVAARAGQGSWSFGALHAVSGAMFVLKTVLVLALAWRFCVASGQSR